MKKILTSLIQYIEKQPLDNKEVYFNYIKKMELTESSKISMDTKDIGQGDIFFAIRNGNDYIDVAFEKGASFVICDREQDIKNERILCVKDTISAMQELGNIYRKQCNFKIVAITGSNGKTSTKDILYSILKEQFKVERTRGNLNTQIGVPYTILGAAEDLDYIVLEMGMSDFGHIESLCKIAEPDYGVITNIGLSHIEYLKTQENVFKAKGEMIKYISKENLFLNSDDEFLKSVPGNKVGFNGNVIESENCNNYIVTDFYNQESGSSFLINGDRYETNLYGKYNSINIALGVAVASKIGLTREQILVGLKNIEMTPMRFEKVKWNGLDIINDAYNSSPISLKLALETFDDIFKNRKKTAVLGDMLELGEKEEFYHLNILKEVLALGYSHIFLFGERMKKASENLKLGEDKSGKIETFSDKKLISNRLLLMKDENPVIILKGSRGMKLEDILK